MIITIRNMAKSMVNPIDYHQLYIINYHQRLKIPGRRTLAAAPPEARASGTHGARGRGISPGFFGARPTLKEKPR